MVKISASPHFPRLLGRTPNAFKIPPRPLDWRTGTSHSSRIDSPPPLCLLVLPNEDKWVHSPPNPGATLYLTVLPHKGSPRRPGFSIHWPPSPRCRQTSQSRRKESSRSAGLCAGARALPIAARRRTTGRDVRRVGSKEEKQKSQTTANSCEDVF